MPWSILWDVVVVITVKMYRVRVESRWDRPADPKNFDDEKSSKFLVHPTFVGVGLPFNYGQSLQITYRWKGNLISFPTVCFMAISGMIQGRYRMDKMACPNPWISPNIP
jgi:hypothetical protein